MKSVKNLKFHQVQINNISEKYYTNLNPILDLSPITTSPIKLALSAINTESYITGYVPHIGIIVRCLDSGYK